jgi:glucose/arabinose dehydrogenase
MKKNLFFIGGAVLLIILVAGGYFYWTQLRGAWPAFGPVAPTPSSTPEKQEDAPEQTSELPLKIAEGFRISTFAENLGGARVMTFDPQGQMLVSMPSKGKVAAVIDKNNDGKADETITVLEKLNLPHGLVVRCEKNCKLYVAETDKVSEFDYDAKTLKASNKKKILDLPGGAIHFTRTLQWISTSEGEKLLVSVGSSCNACQEKDERRAAVLIANFDGSGARIFAKGLRNAVFMATHPVTGEVWATEMGRDLLGDDLPPDEINILGDGKNYGWPICYGKNVHDDDFDKNTYIRNPCMEPLETSSHIDIPAHSAPLGLAFIPEEGWPEEYWHNLLVSYHGSWNRSQPTGYKVVRYKLDAQGNYLGEEDFISGWLTGTEAWGRPVDIVAQPGGTLYISDDKGGRIYRVIHMP